MYLKADVLPRFSEWVKSIDSLIVDPMEARKYAKYFLLKYVDPAQSGSRGAIYDLFEDVYEYAKMDKLMNTGKYSAAELMHITNLCYLAYAKVSVMEHDAFDELKYDPIAQWGMVINKDGSEKYT